MRKIRRLMGFTLAAVMPLTLVAANPASADPVSDEAHFVQLLNDLRSSRGLGRLGVNAHLTNTARGWSSHMASVGNISHNPHLAAQSPGNWARLGENVGMGPSVVSLHNAFVASPSHFGNMVNGHYDSVGVGVVMSGSTMYVTVNFMQTQAAPAPRPVHFVPPPPPPPPPPARVAARMVCKRTRKGRVCRQVAVKAKKAKKARKAVKARRVVRRR